MKASARFLSNVSSLGFGRSGRAPLVLVSALALFAALALAFGAAGASAAVPTVTIDPSPTGHYTTADVEGTVNPENNPGGVGWHYEYTTTPLDPFSWIGANGGFIEPPESEGTTPIAFPVTIEGLTPGSNYSVRLVAENFIDSSATSSEATFTTSPVTAPTVSLEPITTKTETTALFKGTVDPNSPGGLDDAGKAAYLTHWQFHCNPGCPGLEDKEVEAEAGQQTVEFHATELEPNTSYEVTITASNAGGEGTAAPQTFSTDEIPPTVAVGAGSSVGSGEYILEGTVNPHNSAITDCVFEYGPTASYGHAAPCERLPATVNKPQFVTASLAGLAVGEVYHFHLSVTNGTGVPVTTPDATFEAHAPCGNESIRAEQGSTFLSDCRSWEQVSAPFKEGFAAGIGRFQYTDGGDRVVYESAGNFGENGLGAAGGNAYLAIRTPDGWINEAANPSGPRYATNVSGGFGFSADLRTGLFEMARSDEGTKSLGFYRRNVDGTFDLLGPAEDPALTPPSTPGGSLFTFPVTPAPAASANLARIVFPRPTGTTSSRLVEYNNDTVGEAVPVGLDNEGNFIPAAESYQLVGGGQLHARDALSDDGRVLFWTNNRAGGNILNGLGELYARIGSTTIAVSASQCAVSCAQGEPDAQFIGAAADGSVGYFMSSDQLVDEDTDETRDIYACEIPAGEPAPVGQFNTCRSLTDITAASTAAEVEGPVAVSEDGTHVYFAAKGVLATNPGADQETAVFGDNNLYLWQRDDQHPQGTTTFIARLDAADSSLFLEPDVGSKSGIPQTTPDGEVLILPARTALIDSGPQADTDGGAPDIYRYDAGSGALARVSVDSAGSGGNQPDFTASIAFPGLRAIPASRSHPSMSSDGRSIVFTTKEALSPFDLNETSDVYIWHQGEVSLVSGGRVSHDAAISEIQLGRAQITADGHAVFFWTAVSLAASDTDTQIDIYVARPDGGFPSLVASTPCDGESTCHAPSRIVPPPPSPSSTSPTAGNEYQPPRCRKGKVRKHRRCVTRPKKSRHRKRHGHRVSAHRAGAAHPAGHAMASDK